MIKNKKIAILQSNYIPWKGYFDLINAVDEFILYDDMQYTRRDWRNRNKIKTPSGLLWLSVPVEVKGKYFQKIKETKIAGKDWGEKHWKSIYMNYCKTKFFDQYKEQFEFVYQSIEKHSYLTDVNYDFIVLVNSILNIQTKISKSWDYNLIEGKTERLVDLCVQAGASEYISGPAARDYIIEDNFKEANIKLTWIDYTGYREYNQLHPPFEHGVSVIDLIFNEGSYATKFMKSFIK